MAGNCVDCGCPLEQWEVPLNSDHLSVCAFCAQLGEFKHDNSMLTCCDECGRPVEPEDTLEIYGLVMCIDCWRPPIISGISDYVHNPPAPDSRGQATRKSRKVKPAEPWRRAASDTDFSVDEGPMRTDLPVGESPTQALEPGEDSQPKPEESQDRARVTVPPRLASKPGKTPSQQQQERTIGSERTSGSHNLERPSPAGNSDTVKPASQERSGKSGCLNLHCTSFLGVVSWQCRASRSIRCARQGRIRQKLFGVKHNSGRNAGSGKLRDVQSWRTLPI